MDFAELNEKVARVFSHFRMKHPGQDTVEQWLEDLGYIPDEAGKWIVRKICNESDGMPRNVVKTFKDLWMAYKSENPDKIRKPEAEFCQVCGESGLIWFLYHIAGHKSPHESFVRCGHCKNWMRAGVSEEIPIMTAGEIKRRGCRLHWRNNKRRHRGSLERTVRADLGKLIDLGAA